MDDLRRHSLAAVMDELGPWWPRGYRRRLAREVARNCPDCALWRRRRDGLRRMHTVYRRRALSRVRRARR